MIKNILNIILGVLAILLAIAVFNGAIVLLKYVGTLFILFVGVKYIFKKYQKSS